ncbi:hybrid sensor histidine kinase/response regulator [Clostridium sp. JN-9]|uniref:ATP-binding response regulator n=1 Tax=Clostridium sp. JN-9 TaxID=2507159 RepID=UPI000FFE2C88|nr:hybrid sensor histidine kinase/response regulator [Clostridium sp. JN-9]QAT40625.1 hybrid sensor histidine kinase/response regulator [Clostridium sp. JN-9]
MENEIASIGQANVLIVDDSSSNIKQLITIFKNSNYKVRNISGDESVFQDLRENPTDIILISAVLKQTDGFHVCESLKVNETLKKIPVIFIFPDYQCIDKDKLFSAGGADYITCPFNYNEVISKVDTQLELSSLKKEAEALNIKVMKRNQKLDEIKKYDRIKTEFFANISHELRTPISVIFSALQIHELKLKQSFSEDSSIDMFKYTKIMKQNCYRLLRLVNNLIDITKIDAGFFTINETNINIVDLIEEIISSVDDYIKNKGLSITFDTDVEEKIIGCDPDKIERIILNLLSNAVKFTPSGGKITVTIEDGKEYICIRVKDTGRGIPKDKLNSIFKRFVQVDKSLARDHEGSGIGLSLVKELVELHGGTILAKSKVGCGSEFIIHLPCKLAHGNADNKNVHVDTISKNSIEKINLEFSDIYN